MKRLNLEISRHKKKYQMHLGNGKFLTFDSKTQAEKHRLKLQRILRENVKMLNVLQPTVNSLYRQSYFQLDQYDISQLSRMLHDYDERFDYIFKSFSSGNKNAFVFSNVNQCYYLLIQIVEKLHGFAQRYKNYGVTSQSSAIINHLNNLQLSFNNDKRNMLLNEFPKVKFLTYKTQNEQFNSSIRRGKT